MEEGRSSEITSLRDLLDDLDMAELILHKRTEMREDGMLSAFRSVRHSGEEPRGQTIDSSFMKQAHSAPTSGSGPGVTARLERVRQERSRLQSRAKDVHASLATRSEEITGIIARMQHLLELADSSMASKVERASAATLQALLAQEESLKAEQSRLLLEQETGILSSSADGSDAAAAVALARVAVGAGAEGAEGSGGGSGAGGEAVEVLDECRALLQHSLRKLDQVSSLARPRALALFVFERPALPPH